MGAIVLQSTNSVHADSEANAAPSISASEPYLRCIQSPPLNYLFKKQQVADTEQKTPSGTWTLHLANSHGNRIAAMFVGPAVGWEGKVATCTISAQAKRIQQSNFLSFNYQTKTISAVNIFSIKKDVYGADTIVCTPNPGDISDIANDKSDKYWLANHNKYINLTVSMHNGAVQSVWSELTQMGYSRTSSNGVVTYYRALSCTNDYTELQAYRWVFEIFYK